MRNLQIALLLSAVLLITGCPNYQPKVDFKNPQSFVGKLNTHLRDEQFRCRCYEQNRDYAPTAADPTACSTTANKPDGKALAQGMRNAMIEDALPYIDGMYLDFITDIQQGRDRQNFIADVIELSSSAALGIIKGPQRSIQIIGIALTAFKGGRRSSDVNFYKDQSTPILISKMDGNRATVRAAILLREGKSIDEYRIGTAIGDIVEYYNAGTLVRAFTELQKDTAIQTRAAQNAVRIVRGDLDISDIPTLEAAARSDSIFKQKRSLEDQVDAATTAAAAETTATLKAAKLKPIRDKLERIWSDIKAQSAFTAAITKMKGDPKYQTILGNLDATPPGNVTEEDYLTLLKGIMAETGGDAVASKAFLDILQKENK